MHSRFAAAKDSSSAPEEFMRPKPCVPRIPYHSSSSCPEPTRALKSPSKTQWSVEEVSFKVRWRSSKKISLLERLAANVGAYALTRVKYSRGQFAVF